MSSTPVRAHISQALDVVLHGLARVIVDGQHRQLGRQLQDGFGRDGAQSLVRVDGVLGEDAVGDLRPQGEEGLEGLFHDFLLVEVDI